MNDNTRHFAIDLIEHSYNKYRSAVTQYITYRIHHKYEAEDLVQDVFIRLLDYKPMLRTDTVKFFIFTIARNIATDYLRKYYKKQEVDLYLYSHTPDSDNEIENRIYTKDLLLLERQKLFSYPKQRRIIYALSRYKEKSISEISDSLNLSRRTVENHLFIGRKVMREFLKRSI